MWLLCPVSPPFPLTCPGRPVRQLWRMPASHKLMGVFVPVGYRGQIMCMHACHDALRHGVDASNKALCAVPVADRFNCQHVICDKALIISGASL